MTATNVRVSRRRKVRTARRHDQLAIQKDMSWNRPKSVTRLEPNHDY
jgi:hypothetical protein